MDSAKETVSAKSDAQRCHDGGHKLVQVRCACGINIEAVESHDAQVARAAAEEMREKVGDKVAFMIEHRKTCALHYCQECDCPASDVIRAVRALPLPAAGDAPQTQTERMSKSDAERCNEEGHKLVQARCMCGIKVRPSDAPRTFTDADLEPLVELARVWGTGPFAGANFASREITCVLASIKGES